jgi:hypothetical protein
LRPHISYSELAEFSTVCQHRWYLNYSQNLRSNIYSIHFDFGTAIHESVENYLTRKNPITVDEAVTNFKVKLNQLYDENSSRYEKPIPEKDFLNLISSGETIIRNLDQCEELQNAEVVHNEYPLFEDIARDDDVSIKFKGFIDLVIKTKAKNGDTVLYVCDFKTCSWGWSRETREDKWKHFQLFLYKHFLCKKFDIDQKFVRTAFILLKKRPPKGTSPVEFFPVSAGPVSVQRALNVLNENLTEMKQRGDKNDFVKNRDSCLDKFGNTCPFKGTPHCP